VAVSISPRAYRWRSISIAEGWDGGIPGVNVGGTWVYVGGIYRCLLLVLSKRITLQISKPRITNQNILPRSKKGSSKPRPCPNPHIMGILSFFQETTIVVVNCNIPFCFIRCFAISSLLICIYVDDNNRVMILSFDVLLEGYSKLSKFSSVT
jgi:hypothetical protein